MKQEEFDFIKDAFSQILDDIAGNPDWSDAASAISADLGALERELEGKVVSSDKSLEEAAEDAVCMAFGGDPAYYGNKAEFSVNECIRLFIAGAEWKEQQMLKDAVEGKVVGFDILNRTILLTNIPTNLNMDDKVRIVVLKEEE